MENISSAPLPVYRKKSRFLFLFLLLLAPAPFYICFDGCLGPQFVLPLIIAWLPVLTVFSLFSPERLLWHFIFVSIFASMFIPLLGYIDRSSVLTLKKTYKVGFYFICWFLVWLLWVQIPLETRQLWLGQHG